LAVEGDDMDTMALWFLSRHIDLYNCSRAEMFYFVNNEVKSLRRGALLCVFKSEGSFEVSFFGVLFRAELIDATSVDANYGASSSTILRSSPESVPNESFEVIFLSSSFS